MRDRTKLTRWTLLTAIIASTALMGGCLEGSAVRTGAYLPPKPPGSHIDVYVDSEPGIAWAEVGLVSAKGTGFNADLNDVVYVLQDQARGLGGDAVIVTETWHEDEVWYDDYGHAHVRKRAYAKGIAIYYL